MVHHVIRKVSGQSVPGSATRRGHLSISGDISPVLQELVEGWGGRLVGLQIDAGGGLTEMRIWVISASTSRGVLA